MPGFISTCTALVAEDLFVRYRLFYVMSDASLKSLATPYRSETFPNTNPAASFLPSSVKASGLGGRFSLVSDVPESDAHRGLDRRR